MTNDILDQDVVKTVMQLQKVLGMLGSAHDGERQAAAAAFTRLCQKAGWCPTELLIVPPGDGNEVIEELTVKDRRGRLSDQKIRIWVAAKQSIRAARDQGYAEGKKEGDRWIERGNEWEKIYKDSVEICESANNTYELIIKLTNLEKTAALVRAEEAETQRDHAVARAERLLARLDALRELVTTPWEDLEEQFNQ